LAVREQAIPSPEILQFRAVLRETSPHVWRRLLVRSDCTLITFHKIVQCAFGWSARRAFVAGIKGHRSRAAAVSNPAMITLADLCLYDKERFGYQETDQDSFSRPWRLEIRLEKKLPIEQNERYPRCIGGSGAAVPEDSGGTTAFECFRDLFTPDYILWRLAEMFDEGWKPDHVKELAGLRPWMNRVYRRREINRHLEREVRS